MSGSAMISSRMELKELLQEKMVDSYDSVNQNQELNEGETYLKSYLIESERPTTKGLLGDTEDYRLKRDKTRESDFENIQIRKLGSDKKARFYIENLDERFWAVHSLAKSKNSDSLLDKLVFPRFTKLDYSWLSNSFLRNIGESPRNDFRSFSLKFEDEFQKARSQEDGSEHPTAREISKMSMRLWGENAKKVLSTLSGDETLGKSTSLSNVGIRRAFDDGRILLEDITHTAKFTARGDSVDGHFYQIEEIKDKYKDILYSLEEDYAIKRGVDKYGGNLTGEPVLISFDREITDFESFFSTLLGSTKPFRLWGLENQIDEDYYSVSAVDLHTGDELDLEVAPNWMRIYLPEDSCGNVILRLYTNIQHYFDSEATLEGSMHGQII
ncbi:hypothetical protein [Natronorubrum aibiense]|uniref:Uncharacterized protein n=1 Tax=Natronorubrum aibiense TaxID=348826 RepID=A0A5P9P384_9EURY|nr:hypothetical protein [Natronorubrum aibiense]QFU82599.1 hypothetical protein GCU68_08735 [Natronorubrum aibiense]